MNRIPNKKNPPARRAPRLQKASRAAGAAGVTLVEIILAAMVLAVASLGALSYQYHAVKRAKTARAETTASQLAQLLIEDWKSHGGEEQYDPTDLHLGFEKTGTSRQYKTTLNGFPMQVELWHKDVQTDSEAGVILREIRVTVSWRRDYLDLTPTADDPTFTITTYVRQDQSGG